MTSRTYDAKLADEIYERMNSKRSIGMTNKRVRLSDHDLDAIISLFCKHFLPEDKLWVFGSRVDLKKKGGDIDLYIETRIRTTEEAINRKSDFLWDLEQKIGEQKIDIILNMLNNPYPLPIHQIAVTKGVRIV